MSMKVLYRDMLQKHKGRRWITRWRGRNEVQILRKAGFILRGSGADRAFELDGRRQQLYAAMLAFLIAIPTVYFAQPGRRGSRGGERLSGS
jgi:hypothetical protein